MRVVLLILIAMLAIKTSAASEKVSCLSVRQQFAASGLSVAQLESLSHMVAPDVASRVRSCLYKRSARRGHWKSSR